MKLKTTAKFILPMLFFAIAFALIAMSLAWYSGKDDAIKSSEVALTSDRNMNEDGTAATLFPIADDYEVNESNYTVINTGTITGYSGQTGDPSQNYADRAYIIFYKVILHNTDINYLLAYDYAYISKCIINWKNDAHEEESYIYGETGDAALTEFQCVFLEKKSFSNGVYDFAASKSLIVESAEGSNVSFYLGLQFYNPNHGIFKFSDEKYMGSHFNLEIRFSRSTDMAFYYLSLFDEVAKGYKTDFDTDSQSEDQKYRMLKTELTEEEKGMNSSGTEKYGSILSVYTLQNPIELTAGSMLKVYNTLSTQNIDEYANNDYTFYKYCFDYYVNEQGKYVYPQTNTGYPIRTTGLYNVRLRVYNAGYKIFIEFPNDIVEFYIKGGYNAWGDNEYKNQGTDLKQLDYLYALVNNSLYRITKCYLNTNGDVATSVDLSNPNFWIITGENTYTQVSKIYNNLGEEVKELYDAKGNALTIGSAPNQSTIVTLTDGAITKGMFYEKVKLYEEKDGKIELTYNYLNSVKFDKYEYYVDSYQEDTLYHSGVYYLSGSKIVPLQSFNLKYQTDEETPQDVISAYNAYGVLNSYLTLHLSDTNDALEVLNSKVTGENYLYDSEGNPIHSLYYYDTVQKKFVGFAGGTYTLMLKMKATERVGVDLMFEFLAYNSYEQYYKYLGTSNYLVDAGVYDIILNYSIFESVGELSFEFIYSYNEATEYDWYIRGSFDDSWSALDDWKFTKVSQGYYKLSGKYMAKNTQFKASNLNWSPSFNHLVCENDVEGALAHFGTVGDGFSNFNISCQIAGIYDFYLSPSKQQITAVYQGAYVGEGSTASYWYLYNDATGISDDYNFVKESDKSTTSHIDSIWLAQDSLYRLYFTKDNTFFVKNWFDSVSSNPDCSNYFEIVTFDETFYARVKKEGYYSFTMKETTTAGKTTYTFTFDYLSADFLKGDFYIKGELNGWSNQEAYQFSHYKNSYYYYLTTDIVLPNTIGDTTYTSYNYKIANGDWSIQTKNVHLYTLVEGQTVMTGEQIVRALNAHDLDEADTTFSDTYELSPDSDTYFNDPGDNANMSLNGNFTFVIRHVRQVVDGKYVDEIYVYAILNPTE